MSPFHKLRLGQATGPTALALLFWTPLRPPETQLCLSEGGRSAKLNEPGPERVMFDQNLSQFLLRPGDHVFDF